MKQKWLERFRSAITGRFVRRREAERAPETTVRERKRVRGIVELLTGRKS